MEKGKYIYTSEAQAKGYSSEGHPKNDQALTLLWCVPTSTEKWVNLAPSIYKRSFHDV